MGSRESIATRVLRRTFHVTFAAVARLRDNCAPVTPLRSHERSERKDAPTAWLFLLLAVELLLNPDSFKATPAQAEMQVFPSVSVIQSYDSNVWGGPKEFIPAGKKQGDFVSAISPQVQVINKDRRTETEFNAGVAGNLYVSNPELDYVSFNAAVLSDLSGWASQFIEGTRLKVADGFVYTPQPPSFLTGGQPPATADVLLRGIQGVRANTFQNNGSVSSSFDLARGFGLQARYNLGIMRFGQIFTQPTQPTAIPVAYFDTTYHGFSIGPTYRVSPEDTVSINYEPTLNYLSGENTDQSFSTHGVTAQYSKSTPHWAATVRAGAVTLDLDGQVYFSGGLSVAGSYDLTTRIRVDVSRKVIPAFYVGGGANLSDTAGMYIDHKISKLLTLSIGGSYARGTSLPVQAFVYKSYQGTAQVKYKLTRQFTASLSYERDYYSYEFPGVGGAGNSGFSFPRNFVSLSINAIWK